MPFDRSIARNQELKTLRSPAGINHLLQSLASIGCTNNEISTLTGLSKDTLSEKSNLLAFGRTKLIASLRKAQIKAALRGNPSMLVWLGKCILHQSDQPNANISQHTNIVVDAGLLSALQSSYQSTLGDIRRAKSLDIPNPDISTFTASNFHLKPQLHPFLDRPDISQPIPDRHSPVLQPIPDKEPALTGLTDVPRGTIPRYETGDDSALERIASSLRPATQDTESEDDTCDTKPIASHNTHHVQLPKSLVANEQACEAETTPLAGPHPQETGTPTPKRLTSLVSGNLGVLGKSKRIGKLAARWRASRKVGVNNEARKSTNQATASRTSQ